MFSGNQGIEQNLVNQTKCTTTCLQRVGTSLESICAGNSLASETNTISSS